MCQPRRRPPSPAQRQADANEDVERIARAMYEQVRGWPWSDLMVGKTLWRGHARALLEAGVIKPGARPAAPEAPIPGQITVEDALNGDG
jgi:hypothetical protein